jgi:hypothetical protein
LVAMRETCESNRASETGVRPSGIGMLEVGKNERGKLRSSACALRLVIHRITSSPVPAATSR